MKATQQQLNSHWYGKTVAIPDNQDAYNARILRPMNDRFWTVKDVFPIVPARENGVIPDINHCNLELVDPDNFDGTDVYHIHAEKVLIVDAAMVLEHTIAPGEEVYLDLYKIPWKWNQPVIGWSCPLPEKKKAGRLVQVRKGVGQFGSDEFWIRLLDGGLIRLSNDMLRPYYGEAISPGTDSRGDTYTIGEKWPETGFLVDHPKQPLGVDPAFAITIMTKRKGED